MVHTSDFPNSSVLSYGIEHSLAKELYDSAITNCVDHVVSRIGIYRADTTKNSKTLDAHSDKLYGQFLQRFFIKLTSDLEKATAVENILIISEDYDLLRNHYDAKKAGDTEQANQIKNLIERTSLMSTIPLIHSTFLNTGRTMILQREKYQIPDSYRDLDIWMACDAYTNIVKDFRKYMQSIGWSKTVSEWNPGLILSETSELDEYLFSKNALPKQMASHY